jgi:hypothetical protein
VLAGGGGVRDEHGTPPGGVVTEGRSK